MAARIRLRDGDLLVELAPAVGGSIARFDAGSDAIFRPAPADAASPLDMASFPMVPFVGRIEEGRFDSGGRAVKLPPNFPGRPDDPHTIHGFGWLGAWELASCDLRSAHLVFEAPPGPWPWTYRAEQVVALEDGALVQTLSVTHLSAGDMPAGLGAHPYVPRDARTRLRARHRAEWITTAQGIPRRAVPHPDGVGDWWGGAPVESRSSIRPMKAATARSRSNGPTGGCVCRSNRTRPWATP